MKYVTEGVIRSLKIEEIEYDLKKNLLGKLLILENNELKISGIKLNKFSIIFSFYKSDDELHLKNIKKIEINHGENAVNIYFKTKCYTISI